MLVVVSPVLTAAVLGGDQVLFLSLKFARNDLRYWLKLDGALSWSVSILFRFFAKLMVDFTVLVQLRRRYFHIVVYPKLSVHNCPLSTSLTPILQIASLLCPQTLSKSAVRTGSLV